MGSSWTNEQYRLLALATSWPALAGSVILCLLALAGYLCCELRNVRGWRDVLVTALFVLTAVWALLHGTVVIMVKGMGG